MSSPITTAIIAADNRENGGGRVNAGDDPWGIYQSAVGSGIFDHNRFFLAGIFWVDIVLNFVSGYDDGPLHVVYPHKPMHLWPM